MARSHVRALRAGRVMARARVSLLERVGLGVVVAWPSGVVFSTQAGGAACLAPELEGVFVPIRNDVEVPSERLLSPEAELMEYFRARDAGDRRLSDADADFIDEVLSRWRGGGDITVDRARLADSYEAWVHVTVAPSASERRPLFDFGADARLGVLTWSNND